MIEQIAFFRLLGSTTEGSPLWRNTFAGLSVLRLVDSAAANPGSSDWMDDATFRSARNAVDAIEQTDPSRAILERALDSLEENRRLTTECGEDLLSYGRALDLEAQWLLAVDVFRTIISAFGGRDERDLVIAASTALGAAARNTGDWLQSDRSYAAAQHLADSANDIAASLTVRVGTAGSQMIRGNLPAADEELDEVLAEATEQNLEAVRAIALHAKASVAHSRGDYQRAVHLAYRSLELTIDKSARERVLADIAAAYAGLGMNETARDGYSIVAITSPHQWVRWQATLNLMELAVIEGDEAEFERLEGQLGSAKLDPRLSAYYRYYRALGYRRFERQGSAEEMRAAYAFASRHALHQVAFEIERSLDPSTPVNAAKGTGEESVPEEGARQELKHIAEVLMHLRERVTA